MKTEEKYEGMNAEITREVASRMSKLMAEKALLHWQSGNDNEAGECAAAALYYRLAAQQLET